jgi:hypothetical protein
MLNGLCFDSLPICAWHSHPRPFPTILLSSTRISHSHPPSLTHTKPKQLLFARLKYSRHRAAVATQPLTHSFHWTQADAFRQHDVQELMRVLFQVCAWWSG